MEVEKGNKVTWVVIADGGYFDLRDDLLRALDKRSWVGRIFKLTYENKPVRRLPE